VPRNIIASGLSQRPTQAAEIHATGKRPTGASMASMPGQTITPGYVFAKACSIYGPSSVATEVAVIVAGPAGSIA
jgi:hypothetical protein